MSEILAALPIIKRTLPKLREQSIRLAKAGLKPKLSVILVGDNPASRTYIRNKKKFCDQIDADFELIELKQDVSEDIFLQEVSRINNDNTVTGCFVQLPVPTQLKHINITQLINPEKDVDGFHFESIKGIYQSKLDGLMPCTPKGIIKLLNEYQIETTGQNIIILGRSYIVGKPLAMALTAMDATVTLCHSKSKNISALTKVADIIISATGQASSLDQEFLNSKKNQILIDVGISKTKRGLEGDFNFQAVKDSCSAITPVPGGVGPMTVLSLMENLIQTTSDILNRK